MDMIMLISAVRHISHLVKQYSTIKWIYSCSNAVCAAGTYY